MGPAGGYFYSGDDDARAPRVAWRTELRRAAYDLPSPPAAARPPIHVTTDGDTLWLYCFADDPDAERGELICSIGPGDSWWDLAGKVDQHITEHGC